MEVLGVGGAYRFGEQFLDDWQEVREGADGAEGDRVGWASVSAGDGEDESGVHGGERDGAIEEVAREAAVGLGKIANEEAERVRRAEEIAAMAWQLACSPAGERLLGESIVFGGISNWDKTWTQRLFAATEAFVAEREARMAKVAAAGTKGED